jgi:hypothetical protein
MLTPGLYCPSGTLQPPKHIRFPRPPGFERGHRRLARRFVKPRFVMESLWAVSEVPTRQGLAEIGSEVGTSDTAT